MRKNHHANKEDRNQEEYYLKKILYYVKVLNPVSLETLSHHLNKTVPALKHMILKFIEQGRLNGKLVRNMVFILPNDQRI
ncbi:MAG: hypothetical protein ACXABG_06465 [Promethearchaeota archaeon]|jgi:hypothetical protein